MIIIKYYFIISLFKGALIIRRDTAHILQKCYFGGGAVLAASADADYCIPKYLNPHDQFEDGTVNFYGIIALKRGFEYLKELGGMSFIQKHTMSLCKYVVKMMRSLYHKQTGIPLVQIYGRHLDDFDDVRYEEIQVNLQII